MKVLIALLILTSLMFSARPMKIDDVDGEPVKRQVDGLLRDRKKIDWIGDIRAIMGGQGKSIIVSQNGAAIAVIYGAVSDDPDNPMEIKIAYSEDSGAKWRRYGPFSGACRRAYNSVDGVSDFHLNNGHLYFIWQENTEGYNDGVLKTMYERRDLSSTPSFSAPAVMPQSQPPGMYPWEPDIAVDPDNPMNLIATAYSYLAYGNEWAYCWISYDGGCTWTDTIPMAHIHPDGCAGNLSRGTIGYVVYTYLDYGNVGGSDSTLVPFYMESTDGGYTWSQETRVPGVPANASSTFWWHELDCLVINDQPWFVHNDIGTPGGGPYIMRGTGSPGNWTWTIWDAGVLGYDSTWYGSHIWYCLPSQYPSLAYNPVNDMVLCTYKSNVIIDTTHNGPHIQGIYTIDGGQSWDITDPLSSATTNIVWGDWSATETAHRLVQVGGYSKAYSVWVDGTALVLYFECEYVTPWGTPIGARLQDSGFVSLISPGMSSIVQNSHRVQYVIRDAGHASMKIYDVAGRCVNEVFTGYCTEGSHEQNIDLQGLKNGTYFLVLETGSGQQVEKIVVVR